MKTAVLCNHSQYFNLLKFPSRSPHRPFDSLQFEWHFFFATPFKKLSDLNRGEVEISVHAAVIDTESIKFWRRKNGSLCLISEHFDQTKFPVKTIWNETLLPCHFIETLRVKIVPKVTGLISRNRYSCFVYHLVFFHRILRRIADSFDRGKDKGCKLCVRRRQKFQAATKESSRAILKPFWWRQFILFSF